MTQTKKFEQANVTHAPELAEVKEGWKKEQETHAREVEEANRTHAHEVEEANRTHARELAEVREGWKKAKETHEREVNEALSTMLKAQLIVVSH